MNVLIKVDRLLNSAKTVAMETFQVESCVRGHHIYKYIFFGEVLQYTRELENTKDRYAVAVVRIYRSTVVGHIPRKIAAASALFLASKGTICFEVTGTQCYSEDLPRGGLEIPWKLTFSHRADSAPRA